MALAVLAACSSNPTPAANGGGTTPATSPGGGTSVASASGKPNILFVLTDDMRLDDLQFMPHVRDLLASKGVSFDAYFDNVTLCCPSRTTILRGQYSHNTKVLTNGGSNGGFETAYKIGVEQHMIAPALHDAGYTTGLFGKYLNGYPNTASNTYIPPGWDTWSSSVKGNAYGEFNYTLNENAKLVQYGNKPADYGTDVYVHQAEDFIARAGTDHKPFFAYLAVYAPHQPATPAPRHDQLFPDLKAPRDAAFNEADVSDKPAYIRDAPELSDVVQKRIDTLYGKRARSLQAVDEGVADLIDHLDRSGQLANTYIVFTSDNGFHLGQHRLPSGKQTAYETDIHLPLIIRGPGIAAGRHVSDIAGNVDLSPTFAAIAGATMTDDPDGRSLLGLTQSDRNSPPWRSSFLLEHWTESSTAPDNPEGPQTEPADPDQTGDVTTDSTTPGAAPADLPTGGPDLGDATAKNPTTTERKGKAALTNIPEYQGLRTAQYTYVEYVTGERELYDLKADPDELNNLAATADPALLASLAQRLKELRDCRGDSCRQAESKPIG